MTAEAAPAPRSSGAISDALAIARYHIVLVAMTASVVFGWILTGKRTWGLALVVGCDWFLINLVNRITDLAEDLKNQIPGTERVARRKNALIWGSMALFVGSLVATHVLWPWLTPWRLAVQAIGVAYNYRVIPTGRGRTRFKETYLLKNLMSAVLFVLTCFAYPMVAERSDVGAKLAQAGVLIGFFVPFELTYEILYDLRDLEGDRAEGIPTFPVVHGPLVARHIIDALLALSTAVLSLGVGLGVVGVRELLMVVAPAVQLAFYRPLFARGLSTRDCIVVTHLGTAQLALFLAGTALWERAGLPANIMLGAP